MKLMVNTGRPQPGFFRITGKKYFVLYRSQAINISYSTSGSLVFPDHRQKIFRTLPITGKKYFVLYLRQPGFSGSQTKNISYPTDHRQKIFRTLPQMAWGGEFFSSDIMWWLGDWTRLILHQLPLPRKSLKRG